MLTSCYLWQKTYSGAWSLPKSGTMILWKNVCKVTWCELLCYTLTKTSQLPVIGKLWNLHFVKVAKDSQGVDVISDDDRHLIYIQTCGYTCNYEQWCTIFCDFISDQCVYLFESQDSILPQIECLNCACV